MKAMKVLHLILKHRWFDMIASGEKPEEVLPGLYGLPVLRQRRKHQE